MKSNWCWWRMIAWAGWISLSFSVGVAASPRERLLLDFGWKFHLGNDWGLAQDLSKAGLGSGPASVSFGDSDWRTVQLPHDWAIELPFDPKADGSHGFKPIGPGFPTNSVGWYRRTFALPAADAGKRIWVEFDGVFRDAVVFVNGWCVGHHEGGYNGFRYDITDVVHCGGTNVLAVRADTSQFEGWFYEGAGIYRHVWLVKTAPLAIAPDGTFVFARFEQNRPEGVPKLQVQTRLVSTDTVNRQPTLRYEVVGPTGASFVKVEKRVELAAGRQLEVTSVVHLPRRLWSSEWLWSPENPKLYRLRTTVECQGTVVDQAETEFGIRTVAFDAERGFLLNGAPYVLKGTCNHQDHAGVGAALPDRLQYFRIARLKEMGCNAYRCSHNPPTPELLEACDRLGMLVMDENRLLGSDEANLARLENLVLRDRNHPSVVIWSIANEEFATHATPAGGRVAATMQRRIKELDPTRPVTYAANLGNTWEGIDGVIEVRGWNYHLGKESMDAYHQAHPAQPNVGTEQGSTVCTRGIYANDKERGYVSAYDENAPSWAHTAETWWPFFAARPWLSGGFVWTGFDYRGEPTPYDWPCISSHFGILDTCGFPKDNFWYYQAWWTAKPVLHLLPHWNWQGREGKEIDVRALSNCEEVELSLNGQSLGRRPVKPNSHARWQVNYAPGALAAKGFKAGRVVAEATVETTGVPAALRLSPDRTEIAADGEDVSVITVSVRDAAGRVVPVAGNRVEFVLEGPGRLIGVGNGDPSCHEPDVFVAQMPGHSRAIEGWRWTAVPDPRKAGLAEEQEAFDDAKWASADVRSGWGPLAQRQHAVFRARFEVSDRELAAPSVQLRFGMVDEEGWFYLNGIKVGESHDWQTSPVFDVKQALHVGQNTIAVAVANYSGAGGINKGVTLQVQEKPVLPKWSRSVFNGLAQVLVQASKESGTIRLTARAEGLTVAEAAIAAVKATPRPAVPEP